MADIRPGIEQKLRPAEAAPVTEGAAEAHTERERGAVAALAEEISEAVSAAPAVPSAPVAAEVAPTAKDPVLFELEGILASGLEEIYKKMAPSEQQKFRAKGEETASKIKEMMDRAKLRARKVLALIQKWLSLIPGVSKFFLEQEAKIKTDRVMEYSEKRKEK